MNVMCYFVFPYQKIIKSRFQNKTIKTKPYEQHKDIEELKQEAYIEKHPKFD